MPEASLQQIDEALKQIYSISSVPKQRSKKRPVKNHRKERFRLRRFCFRAILWATAVCVAVILPFIVLIRVAVYAYSFHSLTTWPAVALGAVITSIILMLYVIFISMKVGGKSLSFKRSAQAMLVIVGLYCGYTLLYISGDNVKSEAVRETYTALHPLLRLSVSTVALFDRGMIVTDTARRPEDYEAMGLQPLENSLHYRQQDGYAHAIDLRTIGRSEWQNTAMNVYFELMGFNTLRHVGSADHLHVSLPLNF